MTPIPSQPDPQARLKKLSAASEDVLRKVSAMSPKEVDRLYPQLIRADARAELHDIAAKALKNFAG